MKRLLALGLLVFGFAALGLADGHKDHDKDRGKGKKDPVSMPEGTAFELPYFVLGAASLGLWRWRHPKPPSSARSNQAEGLDIPRKNQLPRTFCAANP
jgi:hypothetical protein